MTFFLVQHIFKPNYEQIDWTVGDHGSSFHEKSYDNNTGLGPINKGADSLMNFSKCLPAWY